MAVLQFGQGQLDRPHPLSVTSIKQSLDVSTKSGKQRAVDRPTGLVKRGSQGPQLGRRTGKTVYEQSRRFTSIPPKRLVFFALKKT